MLTMAKQQFVDMVKAVVDVEEGIMAIGGELHSDEEAMLCHLCKLASRFLHSESPKAHIVSIIDLPCNLILLLACPARKDESEITFSLHTQPTGSRRGSRKLIYRLGG